MLELAVLGLLQDQPLHGYELKKRLGDQLGFLSGVSFGSLYPALRRLEKAGAIEAVSGADLEAAGPATSTGSLSGDLAAGRGRRKARPSRRRRKAYRITDRGQELFAELLAADAAPGSDEERTFALKLSFCRYLRSGARVALLEQRRASLTRRLDRVRHASAGLDDQESSGDAASRPSDTYTRSLLEHSGETTEHDLEWVDGLIAAERRESERQGGSTR